MNPFTKSLAARLKSAQLTSFLERWDKLEALAIRTFRAKGASASDERDYAELRPWLQEHYQVWEAELTPLWRQALRGGEPCEDDPFTFLLQPETARDFAGSWAYLQALPAAREALNRLILAFEQP